MTHRLWGRFLATAIFLAGLSGLGFAAGIPKSIQLAVLPCNNIEITFQKFYPLLSYLTQQTNLDIRLVVPADLAAYEKSLKKGEIDFALHDPHTYLQLAEFYNQGEILRTLSVDGGTTQAAVVVVRNDSNIKMLSGLRGKTVMFGPKSSITKWVAAKRLFKKNGINLDKDLRSYVHGGCCEDIAFSVYLKSVDAGVVCDHFLAEHSEKQEELGVEASRILVIGRTEPAPTRVFAPYKEVSKDVVSKVHAALLALDRKNPEHAKILHRGELGGFARGKNADFEAVWKLMQDHVGD